MVGDKEVVSLAQITTLTISAVATNNWKTYIGINMEWLVQYQHCLNQEDWNQKIPDQMKATITELYKLQK